MAWEQIQYLPREMKRKSLGWVISSHKSCHLYRNITINCLEQKYFILLNFILFKISGALGQLGQGLSKLLKKKYGNENVVMSDIVRASRDVTETGRSRELQMVTYSFLYWDNSFKSKEGDWIKLGTFTNGKN